MNNMKIVYLVKLPRKLKKWVRNTCFDYMNNKYNTDGGYVYIHGADYAGVLWTQSPKKLSDYDVEMRHGNAMIFKSN